LYVASRGQINTLRDTNGDGVADENKVILDKLFTLDIQHSNNGITFGPDGKLYIAIGGPRVGQLELKDQTYWYQGQPRDDWQFAGILQADPDGKNVKLWARGLRNPYNLAFNSSGQLFATDNGDETIPVPDGDELNLIEPGADYGYPYYFGIPPPWTNTRVPIIAFLPHTAPTGITVYEANQFPADYKGDVMVALYWRGRPGASYRQLVRVFQAEQDGKKVWKMRNFVEGLDRPIALAVGPDGSLFIADMRGGKGDAQFPGTIYRVTYKGS
jgi:glucose/arabinose dehydrogenase